MQTKQTKEITKPNGEPLINIVYTIPQNKPLMTEGWHNFSIEGYETYCEFQDDWVFVPLSQISGTAYQKLLTLMVTNE